MWAWHDPRESLGWNPNFQKPHHLKSLLLLTPFLSGFHGPFAKIQQHANTCLDLVLSHQVSTHFNEQYKYYSSARAFKVASISPFICLCCGGPQKVHWWLTFVHTLHSFLSQLIIAHYTLHINLHEQLMVPMVTRYIHFIVQMTLGLGALVFKFPKHQANHLRLKFIYPKI